MFPSRTRVKDFIIKYEESHRLLKSEFLRPVFELSKLCPVLLGLVVWSPIFHFRVEFMQFLRGRQLLIFQHQKSLDKRVFSREITSNFPIC